MKSHLHAEWTAPGTQLRLSWVDGRHLFPMPPCPPAAGGGIGWMLPSASGCTWILIQFSMNGGRPRPYRGYILVVMHHEQNDASFLFMTHHFWFPAQ